MTNKRSTEVDVLNPPPNVPRVDRAMLNEHLERAARDPDGERTALAADSALTAALWPLRTALEREAGAEWRAPYDVETVASHVLGRLAAMRATEGLPAVELPDSTLAHWKRLARPPQSIPLGDYVLERIAARETQNRQDPEQRRSEEQQTADDQRQQPGRRRKKDER